LLQTYGIVYIGYIHNQAQCDALPEGIELKKENGKTTLVLLSSVMIAIEYNIGS